MWQNSKRKLLLPSLHKSNNTPPS